MENNTSLFLAYLLIGVVILSLIPTPGRYYLMLIIVIAGATFVNASGSLSNLWAVLTGEEKEN